MIALAYFSVHKVSPVLSSVLAVCKQRKHKLNMKLDLYVHSWDPATPSVWDLIRGRYWSAKIDDISLWPNVRKDMRMLHCHVEQCEFLLFLMSYHKNCRLVRKQNIFYAAVRSLSNWTQKNDPSWTYGKEKKFSSYIRIFRKDQLQSHLYIWLKDSSVFIYG